MIGSITKSTKLYSTLFIYLLYCYYNRLYNRLQSVNGLLVFAFVTYNAQTLRHRIQLVLRCFCSLHPVWNTVGPVAALRPLHNAFHVDTRPNSRECVS